MTPLHLMKIWLPQRKRAPPPRPNTLLSNPLCSLQEPVHFVTLGMVTKGQLRATFVSAILGILCWLRPLLVGTKHAPFFSNLSIKDSVNILLKVLLSGE